MTTLLSTTITTAVTAAVTAPVSFRRGPLRNATIQGVFTYGSGGTTAKVWVQTSFDGGTTWCDIALLSVTTASATSIWNVSSLTVKTTAVTPTDGTLASATANDGMVGSLWRTKMTTTGTYAGNTTVRVDVVGSSGG
jgi:hypothetical protein